MPIVATYLRAMRKGLDAARRSHDGVSIGAELKSYEAADVGDDDDPGATGNRSG